MFASAQKTSLGPKATPFQPARQTPKTPVAMLQRAPSCACGGGCPRCRGSSTIKVSAPDDSFEREADRMADAVLSARPDAAAPAISSGAALGLNRKALGPDEIADSIAPFGEESTSTSSAIEEPETMQRKAVGEAGAVTPGYDRSLQQAVRGGGETLPTATRSFMESRFGWDFSSVRIHNDGAAGSLARQVNARAFTVGSDIFFGQSEYGTQSREGQRLLAHELTHVVQQTSGRISRQIMRTPTRCTSYPAYDASIDRLTYNCAGLALRSYRFTSPPSAVYAEMGAEFFNPVCPAGDCEPGQVKFWLWEYDIHTEDDLGAVVNTTWSDFHIVGGRMGANGANPTNVYSKNGRRPIHGPGTGPGFRPASRDRALDNDDNPGTSPAGRPLYKIRGNMTETISCAGCF